MITVQRTSDRYAAQELTSDDLLEAANALFKAAAFAAKPELRRPEPEAATVGRVEG